jgi:hypothetical protein
MMTIEQTIDIPADRKLYLELPETVPSGRTKVIINFETLPLRTITPSPRKFSPELQAAIKEAEKSGYGGLLTRKNLKPGWKERGKAVPSLAVLTGWSISGRCAVSGSVTDR